MNRVGLLFNILNGFIILYLVLACLGIPEEIMEVLNIVSVAVVVSVSFLLLKSKKIPAFRLAKNKKEDFFNF